MNFFLNRSRTNVDEDEKRMDYNNHENNTTTSLLSSSSTMTQRTDLLLLQQQQQSSEQGQLQSQQQQLQPPNPPPNKKRNRKRNKNKNNITTSGTNEGGWKYNIIRLLLSKKCFRSIVFILVFCYLLLSITATYRIIFYTKVGIDIQKKSYQSIEYFTSSASSSTTNLSSSAIQLFQDIYSRTTDSMNDILKSIDVSSSMSSLSSTIRTLAQYHEHHDICHGCLYETFSSKNKIKTCFIEINEIMAQQPDMSFIDASINISYIHPNYCQRCDPVQCQQEGGGKGNVMKKHEKKFYRIDDIMTNSYMIKDAKTYRLLDPSPTNNAGVQISGHGIHSDHRIPWSILNNPSQLTHYLSDSKNLYPKRKYFYEYNPSIILLPIHQRPMKDAIYLMSFRVSTYNRCLMYDDLMAIYNSYTPNGKNYNEDHLGFAILNENLEIISQTVVNFMKVAKFKSNFADPRLFVLRNQIYIGSYHVINPIWLVPPSDNDNDDIDKKVYQVDGQESTFEEATTILSYYYQDGLDSSNTNDDMDIYVRIARSCHTLGYEQYGGKNINFFVDNKDRIVTELYPLGRKELLNVSQTCQMKSRYDVQSNNALMESSNQANGIYPVRSYGTSDELQYIQQNIDYKPYTNEWGSICCINVQHPIDNRNLLLGISHNKISSLNRKVPRNMTYNYYSTFYVMENVEPYNVVARSGRFCLGNRNPIDILKETKVTSTNEQLLIYQYPRLYNDPLLVGNETYIKCPKVHFITGMTEQYNNSNNIIISYGIDDCISRIIVVEKSKILQLIFNPHDNLLLLPQ